jgi:hypothetical protein
MSEQEVIKHTKKVFKSWSDRKIAFGNKIKEIFIEIFIIVFAITLTIWFNNWNEHKREQEQVKIFLTGLKEDLKTDIYVTKEILKTYDQYKLLYTYLSNLDKRISPNKDTLKIAFQYLNSTTFLRPHKSRFTGFLSTGKIMDIKNDSLTQNILNYYEETIPALQSSEQFWLSQHELYVSYLIDNCKDLDNDMSKWEVLTRSKARYLSRILIPWPQLTERYNSVINEANKIIIQINKLYDNK